METVDAIVVGAGVVGLAVARELALGGREVLVLEAEGIIGSGTSSRNSEVIHAGIYYPHGSLMARMCVEGRRLLYDYCHAHGVAHAMCGKLIVATDAGEAERLEAIAAHALGNGVDDLMRLDADAVRAMEPALSAVAALHSPSTGIVDSHGLMLALQGDAENAGAIFAFHSPVVSAGTRSSGIVLDVGGAEPMQLHCRTLVNAAGLGATRLARSIQGLPAHLVPETYYAKGNYFSLASRAPFRHLIYPVPVPGGLGTHLTLDLMGRARFGPDVEWIEEIDYTVDPSRAEQFVAAIRRYWPSLPDGDLAPDYAGIRPKISAPGASAMDFSVQCHDVHGIPGLINLFGIESPGLTSSLALARYVKLKADLN